MPSRPYRSEQSMDNSPPFPDQPSIPGGSGFAPFPGNELVSGGDFVQGSDFVLGYPATEPATVDLGPIPSGVGAKPSGKSPSAAAKLNAGTAPQTKPTNRTGPPLPKRPKGRFFIGSLFVMVVVGIGYTVFNAMLRYAAYGEVVGRRIDLAVPWPGIVQSIHVREGDHVEFGDLIARIDSLQMRQKIEEIDDSLRLERARLASELAMLRWEAEKIRDTRQLSLSDFYDKWSDLLWQQSRLADLRMQVKRIEPIFREGAASEERLESLRFQLAGQEKKVEQLTEAVRALKQRTDESPIELALEDRVQPTLARIENLQAELQRTRELIRQGEIRAPAAGHIIRTHRFIGEFADQTTPVAEMFVEGSTELVLYLPQANVQDYPIGRTVTLHVNPINADVSCEVQRVAMEMQRAPDSLARHYRVNESLLPIYLRVKDQRNMPSWLTLGSEVRLPRSEDISALARLRCWWTGERINPPAENALQPAETAPPVRTAFEQDASRVIAENQLLGRDGRTAGWIPTP